MPDKHPHWADINQAVARAIENLEKTLCGIKFAIDKQPLFPVNRYSLNLWDSINRQMASCSEQLLSLRKLRNARMIDTHNPDYTILPDLRIERAKMECRNLIKHLHICCVKMAAEIKTYENSLRKVPSGVFGSSSQPSQIDICV